MVACRLEAGGCAAGGRGCAAGGRDYKDKQTMGGNRYVQGLECGNGARGLCIYQNLLNFYCMCSLWYVNNGSIKLFQQKTHLSKDKHFTVSSSFGNGTNHNA